jgi:hypothetical protein
VTHSVSWATLGRPAKAYRVFHATWSVAGLASLGYIWVCAATECGSRSCFASPRTAARSGSGQSRKQDPAGRKRPQPLMPSSHRSHFSNAGRSGEWVGID